MFKNISRIELFGLVYLVIILLAPLFFLNELNSVFNYNNDIFVSLSVITFLLFAYFTNLSFVLFKRTLKLGYLFLSSAFFSLAVFYLIQSIAISDVFVNISYTYKFSEHWQFLLFSILFLSGVVTLKKNIKVKKFNFYTRIYFFLPFILSTILISESFFISNFVMVPIFIYASLSVLTLILLLTSTSLLLHNFLGKNKSFDITTIFAMATITAISIYPIVYIQWAVVWWLFHVLVLVSSIFFSISMLDLFARENQRFSYAIIISVVNVSLLIFFAAASFWSNNYFQDLRYESIIHNKSTSLFVHFESIIESNYKQFGLLSNVLGRNEEIISLFSKKDRDGLLDTVSTIFNSIQKDYGISHLYFIEPDGKVFLRVNEPNLYGDIINRSTFQKSKQTNSPASGVDLGENTLSFRTVSPVFEQNQVIGYIEVGEETSQIRDDLQEKTNNIISIIIDKTLVKKSDWDKVYASGYDLDMQPWDEYSNLVVADGMQRNGENPCLSVDFTGKNIMKHEHGSRYVHQSKVFPQDEAFICLKISLLDAYSNDAGSALFNIDLSQEFAIENRQNLIFIYILNVILFITILISILSANLLVTPVHELVRTTKKMREGNLDAKPKNIYTDEIYYLSQTIESMVGDLKKFKLAAESSAEGIVITDSDENIVFINDTLTNMVGYDRQKILGQNASDLFISKKSPAGFAKKLQSSIRAGNDFYSDNFLLTTKNRGDIICELLISIVKDNNKPQFFVGTIRDITERKKIERSKTEFVSLASHQLRTPLTTIRWYIDTLITGKAGAHKPTKEQLELLNTVEESNKRMIALVGSLLNVSRIEMGSFHIDPVSTNLKELIQGIVDDFMPVINQKKLTVKTKFDKDTPHIFVDQNLMTIIVENLLSNAIKYTPSKGEVSLRLYSDEKKVYLEVQDNGYGIPAYQQDKIFDKLFRADNVKKKDTVGTGLGLYMIKSILEHTGGRIKFESEEDKGSIFQVSIPLSGMISRSGDKELESFYSYKKEEKELI